MLEKKGEEQKLIEVFDKWDLECEQIGEVTDTGMLEFFFDGEMVVEIPAESLVLGGGAPVYERTYNKPGYIKELKKFKLSALSKPKDYVEVAKQLFQSPNILSKKWIYEQYDSMVRTNSMSTNAPSDAAIVRVKESSKALALTVDCNSAYVYADPFKGAMIAVAEAARNIVCSGGEPVAITNCLNFGNPYNPEVYWQFVQTIKGMGEACKKLGTPVTGGNVSFYNQTVIGEKVEPVFPTPTIGMLGIIEDHDKVITLNFKEEGDQIYMIGTPHNDLGSSEYLRFICEIEKSPIPRFDIDEELYIQESLKQLIKMGIVKICP